ncbi:hypothetical protein Pint_28797 [Pistacia integerrima]|uniref:Uncharacterized protein n=1 Tax=Pistacia integerrima TaxID=434235 RepID=A0ACC0WWU2_9ROSI|nr:hypothetical protein Pint_28797 [Pistacia integerrima]
MLSPSSAQGYKSFKPRYNVKLLMRVHHANLIALVGYCDEDTNMGLIYEFMANGNLEAHLLENQAAGILSWEGRLRIATDAAKGKGEYDLNFAFCFSVCLYFLYFASHRLTEKFDVYSFGVVLLEIITGKRAIENATQGIHISKRVGSMIAKADIRNIIDRRLQGDFDINSVWRAVEIAMVCVSSPSSGRPTMNQVEAELNECLKIEIARKKESPVTESRDPRGMVNLDLHTELFPLAR